MCTTQWSLGKSLSNFPDAGAEILSKLYSQNLRAINCSANAPKFCWGSRSLNIAHFSPDCSSIFSYFRRLRCGKSSYNKKKLFQLIFPVMKTMKLLVHVYCFSCRFPPSLYTIWNPKRRDVWRFPIFQPIARLLVRNSSRRESEAWNRHFFQSFTFFQIILSTTLFPGHLYVSIIIINSDLL